MSSLVRSPETDDLPNLGIQDDVKLSVSVQTTKNTVRMHGMQCSEHWIVSVDDNAYRSSHP